VTTAQFSEIVGLLTDIRAVLLALMQQTQGTGESEGCQHPEESRVSFATSNDPDHWVCTAMTEDGPCRYEHIGLTRN
jgi:hypothetical protein